MKIVSMTMVGNESLIIESFIRYTCQIVDEMWLISCCSIDRSLSIIRNLIAEGLPIKLFLDEEHNISYNQRYVDNKYLKMIAAWEQPDWIIPLDADEFICADINPRDIIGNLDTNYIYEVCWKNYAMTERDPEDEFFIPQKLCYFKSGFEGNKFTKAFVPGKQVFAKKVVLSTGHHHAYGEKLKIKFIDSLSVAHYPCVSEEQYKLKINGNSISYIAWSNRGNGEGAHINTQRARLNQGDVLSLANNYGIDGNSGYKLVYEPLVTSWCNKNDLMIKYRDMAKVNYEDSIIKIGQLMALKAYINEQKFLSTGRGIPHILIYGAGKAAETVFNGVPEDIAYVIAYVDSNPDKEFAMYQKRLVIGPEWIRFFEFDQIIISSQKYYDEIKDIILNCGISEDKISGVSFLFDEMCKV